jgi:hypothetical protein
MNFSISLVNLFSEEDAGYVSVNFLEIFWGNRRGALVGLGWHAEMGWGIDLFWLGLAQEQPHG